MSSVKPCDRFKKNMITLLDIISDMFEEASDNNLVESDTKLLTILKVIINSTNGDYMIKNLIKKRESIVLKKEKIPFLIT